MKYFWSFLAILSFHFSRSQSDSVRLYQIYHSEFSNEQKAEWTAFENNWHYFDFSDLKKLYKVKKLNCNNCESLYAELFLRIDEQGKISSAKYLKGKKCGIECHDKYFMQWFEKSLTKQQFKSLKNKTFIARFGHVLKC